ncbi:MAG: prepilin-type N-terminal cleavage/methylation domain-containing protein [Armatimonadota bacterium]
MKKSERLLGFTLVELLIVIILVAVLAAIAIPRFSDSVLRSKESSLSANLALIRLAADRAEADTGLTFPVSALDDQASPTNGWERGAMNTDWAQKSVPAGTWKGPYLTQIPTNPFTNNNTYTGGITNSPSSAWTHYSKQSFNRSYIYFPSTKIGSDGKPYREW